MSFNTCHTKRCAINTKSSLANCTCGFTHRSKKLKIAELRTKLTEAVEALRNCRDTLVLCTMLDKSGQARKSVEVADKLLNKIKG